MRACRSKPIVFPPAIRERMGDFLWEPDEAEIAVNIEERRQKDFAAKMKRFLARFHQEELEYYRRRCDQLAVIVAADKAWIDRQNEIEAGMKKVRDYYESEHRKEEQAADKRRLARLKQIIAEVNADICRTERERFAARGLIRGTR